ncbi:MAG TPA: MGMT family protein [Candidatus Krumholzibacteria bacterium]|nr:MGMT family protein [Candidatus Krumholzibacteria bacterium]HPD70839.1 MGMT family protein [Candidatus Krumholzibacteria bacterium]HRY39461.1 MGMT family protein [Candidatus Krumholzibacteria bacterium]
MKTSRALDHIYAVVLAIPRGRVATYGQVAELAGLPGRARLVGRAMRELPDDSAIPWQRVINARGAISARRGEREQRLLLEDEGVEFDARGRVSLARFGWSG